MSNNLARTREQAEAREPISGYVPMRNTRWRVRLAERRMAIIRGYKAGRTVAELAAEWGVSQNTVHGDINYAMRLLRQSIVSDAADLRALHLDRLQVMFGALFPAMMAGDVSAANAIIRVLEREAALLGLDAPKKVDIEARIRAMAQEGGYDPEQAIEIARQEAIAS